MKKWIEKLLGLGEVEFPEMEEEDFTPSIDENGNFLKEDKFLEIWKAENLKDKYGKSKQLSDSDYIDYKIWYDLNADRLDKELRPEVKVIRGKNPNVIFHGGCLGCKSQRLHGIDKCTGCMYFKADWGKPDLKIEGEDSATFKF